MRTISWQIEFDYQQFCDEEEVNREKIRTLRWELNVDEDMTYTLEELKEMADES